MSEVVQAGSTVVIMNEADWRYTTRKVRVGPFDAMVVIPFFLMFIGYAKPWTFGLLICVVALLWMIELFLSMPIMVVLRTVRCFVAGRRRSAVPWWKVKSL